MGAKYRGRKSPNGTPSARPNGIPPKASLQDFGEILPRRLSDVDQPERFAVLHPGTSPGTEYKRWEPARYAEVARGLASQGGLRSVITWGPVAGERELAVQVVERAGEAALLGPETPDLAAVLALLARSSLFVGGDSGPVHLAALVGRPLVVVFGPTDPVENAPFPGVPHRVLRVDVGCNPCREGCSARACMAAIAPGAAVAAAEALIAAAPPVD